MTNVWVCKVARKREGDPHSDEIPLEEMRKELVMIIGEENVLRMERRVPQGDPQPPLSTATLNAYEITAEGWHILNTGIVGRQGFNLCPDS